MTESIISTHYFDTLAYFKNLPDGTHEVQSEAERDIVRIIIAKGHDTGEGFELTLNDKEDQVKKYPVPIFKAKVK